MGNIWQYFGQYLAYWIYLEDIQQWVSAMSDLDELLADYGSDLEPSAMEEDQQQASGQEEDNAEISDSEQGSPPPTSTEEKAQKGPKFGNAKRAHDERFDSGPPPALVSVIGFLC